MRVSVRHETLYRYSAPVMFAPHVFRLTPRSAGVHVLGSSLTVDPRPVDREDSTDCFGNRVTRVSFQGVSNVLRIESRFDVETLASEPLGDFAPPNLPWTPDPHGEAAAYGFVGREDAAVKAFAVEVASDSGWAALSFLDALTRIVFTRLERRIRFEGASQSPAHTLARGGGACRDFTTLFMAVCRSLGMSARFVSGYQAHAGTLDGRRHLHAWPEVFLLDLGWRGYDPFHGVAVTDGHVALCAAPEQEGAMPVEGGFFGAGVTSTLEYTIQIAATDCGLPDDAVPGSTP